MKRIVLPLFLALVLAASGFPARPGSSLVLAQDGAPGLTTVAYAGMPTPVGGVFQSDPGMTYGRAFFYTNMNSRGDVVFLGQFFKNNSYFFAVFLYDSQTKALTKIVAEGDPTPYGTTFTGVGRPQLTEEGNVVFNAAFRTPPSLNYPNGREAFGLFYYLEGNILPIVTSEEVVFQKPGRDGYFATFLSDINSVGDIVLDGSVNYYESAPDKGPGLSPILETESGVYLLPAGSITWQKVMLQGALAPLGGYISEPYTYDDDHPSVIISDTGYIARSGYIGGSSGAYATRAILLRSPDGWLSRVVTSGDLLPRQGLPDEEKVGVYLLQLVGLNNHGQVAAIIAELGYKRHFYIFSQGQARRVAGWGDPAPGEPADMMFETYPGMVAAINDEQVPVGNLFPDFNATAVFLTPVLDQGTGRYYQDIYSYTPDGAIRPVALGSSPAPDPPGGVLFPVQSGAFDLARLTLNNQGMVLIEGFVQLNASEKRNAILLASLDSDGDGLLDVWEEEGIDANNDGTIDFTLSGANPQHKDIFVEIDYMADSTHSHRPDAGAISDVIRAFANAPVDNPDGTSGINLHVLIDEQLPHNAALRMWDDFDALKASYFGTTWDRTAPNSTDILKALSLVYRYAIFGHQYQYWDDTTGTWQATTSSGMAELPGNDFLVSLGAFTSDVGSRDEQAGTFMHEMGHTVGLRHGGVDDINAKPNYLSIMSYTRQFATFVPDRPFDYSRRQLSALNETNLSEASGIGGDASDKTVFFVDTDGDGFNDSYAIVDGNSPADWNWDGDTTDTGLHAELNSLIRGFDAHGNPVWRFWETQTQTLIGYNDWANLSYNFRETAGFADGAHPETAENEMTWELLTSIRELVAIQTPGAAQYALTMAVNGDGTTSPAAGTHTYTAGTVVDITATPDTGWQFINWTGAVADPNSATTTVTVDADRTVTANFAPLPVADFVATPTGGQAVLVVHFTDLSSGSPTQWLWDFGDGTTSTEQNPSHTYAMAGTYTVSLAASSAAGADSETKANYVTVYAPPQAQFAASPAEITVEQSVQFTDQSTGSIAEWAWDFNSDGVVDSSEQNPSYSYGTSGEYTVSLTVTGPGGSDSETRNITIKKKKGSWFSCARTSAADKASTGELAVVWGAIGLCWGAGYYFVRRVRSR